MKRRSVRSRVVMLAMALAMAAGCLSILPGPASANQPPTEDDLERAFQAVLADPSDLKASFEYAKIAAQMEDFEAAISSLERMLMFKPNLLQVQVELGVMYFRLVS